MLAYTQIPKRELARRGAAAPLVVMSSVVVAGMAALAVDSGVLYRARTELQACADAAALAGVAEMLDEDRLKGTPDPTEEMDAARSQAIAYAARNHVLGAAPAVDANLANATNGDVVFGYLSNPDNLREPLSFAETDRYNTMLVRVRRTDVRNGPVNLFFANIFGIRSVNLGAEAAAIMKDGAVGFRTPDQSKSEHCPLLPFGLHIDAWRGLLAGSLTNGDKYAYDKDTGTVSSGHDGIRELNLYPGSGAGTQLLTPGNFGTLDIGSPDNSASVISSQIRNGPSAADLAYYGGELRLGSDGTVRLTGDTGLSAGFKDDLVSIIGQGRVLPLFNRVNGSGNNSLFTVVGFAGVRIMRVNLEGAMNQKSVLIQPANVVNSTVITGTGSGNSSFVYEPVRLVR